MTSLSEKAIYTYTLPYYPIPIKENDPVSIIHKNFTEFNSSNMKTFSTDDSKFIKGKFRSQKLISQQGYGGNFEYTVELFNIHDFISKVPDQTDKHFKLQKNILTFNVEPRQFYFKLVDPTSIQEQNTHTGGKINLKKTKKKKQKKNKTNKTKQKIIKSKKNKNKIQKNH